MSQNNVSYIRQGRKHLRKVWYTGTDALEKGVGLCYDRDRGTAADKDERRDTYVERPAQASLNNRWFAGVVAHDYVADSKGMMIEIYEPGSICEVAVGVDTVVASTVMTCSAGAADPGRFTLAGFRGRGTALALQTLTNLVASDLTGAASVSGTTLTMTGLLANLATGDRVYIVGGVGGTVTPGLYTATAIDSDTCTLSSAPGNGSVTVYVVNGNPRCSAKLDGTPDGGNGADDESGLQEIISPEDNAAITNIMVGGTTYVAGGYTMGAGQSTFTMADGVVDGERKRWQGLGTLTTQGLKVTVTSGIQKDHSTQLATFVIDAALEVVSFTWHPYEWVCNWTAGATIA